MKHLIGWLACCLSGITGAQSVVNPGFESNCTFDMTGWNWFCSVPDFYSTSGNGSCHALALPTSDAFDPCFSNGELVGVHTLMNGVVAGAPYQLSLYENMSSPDVNSDCGIFAVPAGQVPTSFGTGVLLDTWPVGFSNPGTWIQNIMNFTIPVQYAGMDFYFFIEYSSAPDNVPGMKYFDDITITDLSTGMVTAPSIVRRHWPDPATDRLWMDLQEQPMDIRLFDAQGRSLPLPERSFSDRTLVLTVSALPAGPYVLSVTTAKGQELVRFLKQ